MLFLSKIDFEKTESNKINVEENELVLQLNI